MGLDTPIALDPQTVRTFREQGHVSVCGLLDAAELGSWRAVVRRAAHAHHPDRPPAADQTTYQRAFIQSMNLWTVDDEVRRFVFSRRLASVARQLLEVDGVRLYHDQALLKEAGGGHTPWHVNQYYWPLATDRTVTAWVPLVDVPLEMGPIAFASGSHHAAAGRDLAISDESEAQLTRWVSDEGFVCVERPFALGDVSFHLGWTAHRAGSNQTEHERSAMTVIYMDAQMRLAEPSHRHQALDRAQWVPGIAVGDVCASPLNPVLDGV